MARTFLLEIVTPVRLLVSLEVESMTAAGVDGEFCILPLHAPFLSALRVGTLGYRHDGRAHFVFVRGGFVEVGPDKALVLAEVAELPEEIDVDRAMKARERALARLETERREQIDHTRARAALQRAISRIKVHADAGLAGSRIARGGLGR